MREEDSQWFPELHSTFDRHQDKECLKTFHQTVQCISREQARIILVGLWDGTVVAWDIDKGRQNGWNNFIKAQSSSWIGSMKEHFVLQAGITRLGCGICPQGRK